MSAVHDLQVIYEDNHIIAVNKRTSDIVQADKTGDTPLSEKVKAYIKEKYDKPGEVYLGVVHRIDRPVSGVVLFARTSKAAARLSELFQTKEIRKTYWAIVKNKPAQESGTLVHFLKKNEAKNMSKAFDREQQGALRSELEYRILLSSDNYHLLEVRPVTGRHHQIRVQLAAMGCPIKGDLKYGAKRSNEGGGISLHARKVEFVHPVKQEPVIIEADPPRESLWDFFMKMGAR
jgi:23S rRNA pseudouridine1911/1915/1917 synthase